MSEDMGRVPTRLVRAIWFKLGVFVGLAFVFSSVIAAIHFILIGAAWFAFGDDSPPAPWFLFRFFLFIGWAIAAVVALFARDNASEAPAHPNPGGIDG